MEPGRLQIYTGDGKGKTTAAFGLALRACGAGWRVFIAQFVKGQHYSELDALQRLQDCITIRQYGRECFIHHQPEAEDIRVAQEGWHEVKSVIAANTYRLVILDELAIALYYKLISLDEVMEMIRHKPEAMELVITGRKMPAELMEQADLITEMKEIRHYYQQGIQARKGIEF
ncbi:MAG: cob(I)yrinic acid a,c-diamide adenosyltransferase [Candidatus Delongbacteria bacterium]|nr:cob(I)yrinic acid a,c-diamide adenosyltransferase [Candidatus Delongbacteria bacterium]